MYIAPRDDKSAWIIQCIYKFKKRGRKSLITKDLGPPRPPAADVSHWCPTTYNMDYLKKNSIVKHKIYLKKLHLRVDGGRFLT